MPAASFAKCEGPDKPAMCSEVIVTLGDGSGSATTFTAGTATDVRIFVTRNEQPLPAKTVTLVFASIGEGTVVDIPATLLTPGQWKATVNLPNGGGWIVVAEVADFDGVLTRVKLDTMRVAGPPEPPVATPPTTPVSPTLPALPIALLVAGIAAAALVATELRGRARGGAAGAPAGGAASAASATSSGNAASATSSDRP